MRSRLPRPITGMLPWQSPGCRRARMSMWRSHAAIIPRKGAMLVAAQQKYGKLVQMGTQQRSSPHTIEIVEKIHKGLIGTRLFRQGLVQQYAEVDRDWQGGAGSGAVGLGSVAGPGAAAALQGQCAALQLALVQDLGNRRDAQQWDARSGCVPLGAGCGLSEDGHSFGRQVPVQG